MINSRNHDEIDGYLGSVMEDEETNTNNVGRNFFVSAESQIVVASSNMLQTIREVAEELLATSVIPFRRETP